MEITGREAPWSTQEEWGELTRRLSSGGGGHARRKQRQAVSGRPLAPGPAPTPPAPGPVSPSFAASSLPTRFPRFRRLQSPASFREELEKGPGGAPYLPPAPASSCRAAAPVTGAAPSASQLRGPYPARSANSHL